MADQLAAERAADAPSRSGKDERSDDSDFNPADAEADDREEGDEDAEEEDPDDNNDEDAAPVDEEAVDPLGDGDDEGDAPPKDAPPPAGDRFDNNYTGDAPTTSEAKLHRKRLLAFVREATERKAAAAIRSESTPEAHKRYMDALEDAKKASLQMGKARYQHTTLPKAVPRRLQSATLWMLLAKHLGKARTDKKKGCRSDLSCLKKVVIQAINLGAFALNKEILQGLRSVVANASLPPYNSAAQWFPDVNTAARRTYGNDHKQRRLIFRSMTLPRELKMIADEQAAARLYRKNKFAAQVDYQQALSIVTAWSKSDDMDELHLAIIAAVGTRKTGVIDPTVAYEPATEENVVKADPRFFVIQRGSLKDRVQLRARERAELEGEDVLDAGGLAALAGKRTLKPIMWGLDYAWLTKAVKKVRRAKPALPGMTRGQLGSRYGGNMSQIVRAAFPRAASANPRIGSHFMRALYANVAYHFYGEHFGQSLISFLAEVLGHDTNNLSTAIAYSSIKINFGISEDIEQDTKKLARQNAHLVSKLSADLQELKVDRRAEEEAKLPPRKRIRAARERHADSVELPRKDGNGTVTIEFHERRKMKPEERLALAQESLEKLRQVDIKKVNAQLLRDIGFGAKAAKEAIQKARSGAAFAAAAAVAVTPRKTQRHGKLKAGARSSTPGRARKRARLTASLVF